MTVSEIYPESITRVVCTINSRCSRVGRTEERSDDVPATPTATAIVPELQSAIREAVYKLFVNWTPQGKIASRELYRVNENAIEQGHDLAQKEEGRADALEKRLLEYLSSVNAEKPKPKNGNRKRAPKATRKNQNS